MNKGLAFEYNSDLDTQVRLLYNIIMTRPIVSQVMEQAPKLQLSNWYVGAGFIAQTVWNYHHEFAPETGIKDCDLVYFDRDTSYEAEDTFIQGGKKLFSNVPIEVEIRNEARVHLWYEAKHGIPLRAYTSTEDAINTWPTTATAIGIRNHAGKFEVYAPYGLHDLLNMIVRPNKALISQAIYESKVARWQSIWPKLTIIPWDT